MSEESFADGKAPPLNAGDPVQVRTLERLLSDKHDEQANDLKALLSMPEGRRFIWRVLELCDIYGSTFSQVHAVASLLAGQREVGTKVITWLAAVDPLAYPRLMAEGRQDRATDEAIYAARLAEAKARDQNLSDTAR